MLNQILFKTRQNKIYQNKCNIALLEIPLTSFLHTSGSRQAQVLQHMAKPFECAFKQVSHVHKCFRKTCWAPIRSRPRFHTSLPRCVPEGHMQGKEVGKLWVSLCWWTWRTWVWKHEKYECLIIICHHKSGIFVLWVWKHGPGYPYLKSLRK